MLLIRTVRPRKQSYSRKISISHKFCDFAIIIMIIYIICLYISKTRRLIFSSSIYIYHLKCFLLKFVHLCVTDCLGPNFKNSTKTPKNRVAAADLENYKNFVYGKLLAFSLETFFICDNFH